MCYGRIVEQYNTMTKRLDATEGDEPREQAPPEIELKTVSTVEAAADALRQLILDGGLEPGARLKETEFAERLGVARHTFRAASQILIGEGLLHRLPNRGVQLAVLDADAINDIFKLRAALELEAVRLVVLQERPLDAAARAVERLNAIDDNAPWRSVVDPDMDFHRAIIDATGSERLSRSFATVQSEILLCMAQLRPHYNHPSEVAAEHRELLEPLLHHRLQQAEERFRVHLNDAAANLSKALKAQEETIA